MFKFLKKNYEMRIFFLMVLLYGIAIIVSTIYVYARLDYVRSYNIEVTQEKPTN